MPHLIHPNRWSMKPGLGVLVNPSHPLARGMVACYLFNEVGGRLAIDATGISASGAFSGGSGWNRGRFGSCLTLDGTNGYVDCGNGSSLNLGTGDFTIGIWIKPGNLGAANREIPLISKAADYHLSDGFAFEIHTYGGSATTYLASFYLCASATQANLDSTIVNTVNEWHHFVYVRRGTTLTAYRDGVQDVTGTTADYGLSISGASNVQFGKKIGFQSIEYPGLMDIATFHSRVLSAAEIRQLYVDPFGMLATAGRMWADVEAAPAGRTTKNTRSNPLGVEIGMGWQMGQ